VTWYIVFVTRTYMAINANGARKPARIDRPDQHIYKIMTNKKPLCDAAYVLMEGSGAGGRFNRAQRAAAHMDESLPLYLTGAMLTACVFGPISVIISLIYACARVGYANSYTRHLKDRLGSIYWIFISEQLSAGLVLFVAIKAAMY
jgi:hypothetical protein